MPPPPPPPPNLRPPPPLIPPPPPPVPAAARQHLCHAVWRTWWPHAAVAALAPCPGRKAEVPVASVASSASLSVMVAVLAALFYVAFVYSTIPYMPQAWSLLRAYTGEAIRHVGIGAVVLFAIAVVVSIWRTRAHYTLSRYALLASLAAVYAYMLSAFAQFPAERLHLVEYGFMGYMFLRALRIDLPTGWPTPWPGE